MNVNNIKNNNQTFNAFYIDSKKLNLKQSYKIDHLTDTLKKHPVYNIIKPSGIDTYFTLGKDNKTIIAKFMDKTSDSFILNTEQDIPLSIGLVGPTFKNVRKITRLYKKLRANYFRQPKYDKSKIVNRQTDLAIIRPAIYDKYTSTAKTVFKDLSQEDAFLQAQKYVNRVELCYDSDF